MLKEDFGFATSGIGSCLPGLGCYQIGTSARSFRELDQPSSTTSKVAISPELEALLETDRNKAVVPVAKSAKGSRLE